MSSNPLMMDYGDHLTTIRCCLWSMSGCRAEPVCAGCGRWPEWPDGPDQWRECITGVYTRRCAIQINVLYLLPFVAAAVNVV